LAAFRYAQPVCFHGAGRKAMRELKIVAGAVAIVFSLTGCAVRQRSWSTCAVAGAVIGATVGGVTGGAAVNNGKRHPSSEERGAGIGGGIAVGSDAYNKKLSERRAEAVKRYLVRQGVDPSRVRTEGYGKSRPVADNNTAEGRAKNRRAEVVVESRVWPCCPGSARLGGPSGAGRGRPPRPLSPRLRPARRRGAGRAPESA